MSGLLIERHKKIIIFASPARSYIRSLFPEAQDFLKETNVQEGRMRLFSPHTTMGLILQETDEPKLLNDLVWLSRMLVPTDPRGSVFKSGEIDPYKFPVSPDWTHNCEDNPLLPPGERDHDRNGDRHARAQIMTSSEIGMDIEKGKLLIGRFKKPAAFELDGGEQTIDREARIRKVFFTIEEYSKGPKIYPSVEIPPYKP